MDWILGMADTKKLLELINKKNLSEDYDDDKRKEIARQVCEGFEIDKESRSEWLDKNTRAMEMVHQVGEAAAEKNDPFENSARVIYPLLAPAIIQSTARLVPHLRRNDKAVLIHVAGEDPMGTIQERAERVSKYLNWEILVKSKWMLRSHKLTSILTAWGMCFRKQYFDEIRDEVCDEILHPRDVIINNATQTLEDANRITVISYLNQNDIVSQINLGYFNSDLDPTLKDKSKFDLLKDGNYETIENDPKDDQPIYEILEQYCYLDLDEDGYAEPYIAFVHAPSETLMGLYCAYEADDIKLDRNLNFIAIERRLRITDYHYIDDPDGGYYSIGLNHLLINPNEAINALLRQLEDSGTLANYQGGFCTKLAKTKQRDLRFTKPGQWKVLECPPDTDLTKAFLPLPTKEPSAVLFQLLGLLIESGKEIGGITDIMTGDTPAQNVPATTILALIEQGTRAFKPIVEKLFYSLATEMKIRFHLSKNISQEKYQRFHNNEQVSLVQDFEEDSFDITPVADPSISSEAQKYARMQALIQAMPNFPGLINPSAVLVEYLKQLELHNPEQYMIPPEQQQQAPDPKLIAAQLKHQVDMAKLQIMQADEQIKQKEVEVKMLKTKIDQQEMALKANESQAKIGKMKADAFKDQQQAEHSERMTKVAEEKNDLEAERIRVMEIAARNKART